MNTDNVFRICCDIMGEDISVRSQKRHLVFLRAVYYKVCNDNGFQLTDMGRSCKKDHATAIHGLKIFERDIAREKSRYHKFYHGLYKDCSAAIRAAKEIEVQYLDKFNEMEERIDGLDARLDVFIKLFMKESSF